MVMTARGGHRSESQNCLPRCVDVLFGSRMMGAAHAGLMHVHHHPQCVIYLYVSCLQMQGCNLVVDTTVFSYIYPKLALKSLILPVLTLFFLCCSPTPSPASLFLLPPSLPRSLSSLHSSISVSLPPFNLFTSYFLIYSTSL